MALGTPIHHRRFGVTKLAEVEEPAMSLPRARPSSETSEVVESADIMGGQPVISGTRIPAATILAYLRDGHAIREILEDYPSLPPDGSDAVRRWVARQSDADEARFVARMKRWRNAGDAARV